MNTANESWTDEKVDQLKALYAHPENYSYSEIGERIGASRGSVSSKIRRLGLPVRGKSQGARHILKCTHKKNFTETESPNSNVRTRPTPVHIGVVNAARDRAQSATKPEPFIVKSVNIIPLHIPFDDLSETTCKFECSGQADAALFTFCGHKSYRGKPYCVAHCRVVYEPPPKRKARIYPHEMNKGRGGSFGRGRAA